MEFPIRCFTCGSVLAHMYEDYGKRVDGGEDASMVLDSLGVDRYCCRRMFLSHVDGMGVIKKYEKL